MGGENPIQLQSMTNTSTMDTEKCLTQIKRIVDAGADLVRLTAQGVAESENLKIIKKELHNQGYAVPLIADIHFNPQAAEVAAEHIEKVRINPGNYTDRYRKDKIHFTDEEYQQDLEKIQTRLKPLIEICKKSHTAMRIGSNHGSLSQRIMSRYGDSPEGMVESAMEFLRICHNLDYHQIVVSMKSSNTQVMTEATLRMAEKMQQENLNFPIHLGVTEAGDGLEGRIKSALGIGCLLLHGIGDTIRVSLTEAPEKELPAAIAIKTCAENHKAFSANFERPTIPETYKRKKNIHQTLTPFVIGEPTEGVTSATADFAPDNTPGLYTITSIDALKNLPQERETFIVVDGSMEFQWDIVMALKQKEVQNPIILKKNSAEQSKIQFAIQNALELSLFLYYDLIEGIWLKNKNLPNNHLTEVAFAILQASGRRITKTEFISCPSCGRTKYDIESTLQSVKSRTSHLRGLKIAVMGCIVNGPGEMADADYGYVGEGAGKVTLYKGKKVMQKHIAETEALDNLVELIKSEGDWIEP